MVEAARQRGVVPVEHAQDLATDVFVRLAVVAHVEVSQLGLLQALLDSLVVLDLGQERARLDVLVAAQEPGEQVHRLPDAVLAQERVGAAARGFGVRRRKRQQGPSGLLGARPVAGQQAQAELHPARARTLRRDRERALGERRGGVEAPSVLGASSGGEQHAFEQVAGLGGTARVEVFGVAQVLGRERHAGLQPRDQPERRGLVGRRCGVALRGRAGGERRRSDGRREVSQHDGLGQ